MLVNKKYDLIIGIDPGVNTGYAVWNKQDKKFTEITSTSIYTALLWVSSLNLKKEIFVRIEDARKRKWFGNAGREKLQGVGSVKRDCKIWEDFLKEQGIDFEFVFPKNIKTKLDAKQFNKITGILTKTNQHGRDAAMLVYGM